MELMLAFVLIVILRNLILKIGGNLPLDITIVSTSNIPVKGSRINYNIGKRVHPILIDLMLPRGVAPLPETGKKISSALTT
jgi:hypothetical protein